MPRPTLLTDDLQKAAVKLAAAGVPKEVIGPGIGIGRTTFFTWLRWGKRGYKPEPGEHHPEDLTPYQEFWDAIDLAQAKPILLCEATMLKAVQEGDPKVAERWLKMHRPDLYRESIDIGLGDLGESMKAAMDATRAMIDKAMREKNGDDPLPDEDDDDFDGAAVPVR